MQLVFSDFKSQVGEENIYQSIALKKWFRLQFVRDRNLQYTLNHDDAIIPPVLNPNQMEDDRIKKHFKMFCCPVKNIKGKKKGPSTSGSKR